MTIPPEEFSEFPDTARPGFWSWLGHAAGAWLEPKLIFPLLQALLIVALGLNFTNKFTAALEERKLDLASAKEMQAQVLALQQSGDSLQKAEAAAVGLAIYGSTSIAPLLQALDRGREKQKAGAALGLRAVAIRDPDAVVDQLCRLIANRTKFWSWETHLSAIKLLGVIGEPSALLTLHRYEAALPDSAMDEAARIEAFMKIVSPNNPKPDAASIETIRTEVRTSIAGLQSVQASVPRRPWWRFWGHA